MFQTLSLYLRQKQLWVLVGHHDLPRDYNNVIYLIILFPPKFSFSILFKQKVENCCSLKEHCRCRMASWGWSSSKPVLMTGSHTVNDDESWHCTLLAGLTHRAWLGELGKDPRRAQVINPSLEEAGLQRELVDFLWPQLQLVLGLPQPCKRTMNL